MVSAASNNTATATGESSTDSTDNNTPPLSTQEYLLSIENTEEYGTILHAMSTCLPDAKNERSKQDEEGQIKIIIMMRRARGHFEKARVNRYSSITFWSLHFDGPFKNYSNEISRYLTILLFFRKKKHFDRA
jgi:hypothetical protein